MKNIQPKDRVYYASWSNTYLMMSQKAEDVPGDMAGAMLVPDVVMGGDRHYAWLLSRQSFDAKWMKEHLAANKWISRYYSLGEADGGSDIVREFEAWVRCEGGRVLPWEKRGV